MPAFTSLRRFACFGLVASLVVGLTLGVTPLTPAFVAPHPAFADSSSETMEWQFIDALNKERRDRGLNELRVSAGLRDVTRRWSNQMATDDRLYHNPNLASDVTGVSRTWTRAGENVGVGYSMSSLHDAFMNSPAHRENILGTWNYLAIGVTQVGSKIWVTEEFMADSSSLATVSRQVPPPSADWYLRNANSPGSFNVGFEYGMASYQTLSCDWNGDGTDTAGVFVGDTFYLRNSNSAGPPDVTIRFGWPGVKPVCGDWNGDGIDTIGVFSGDTFYLRNSNTPGSADLVARYGWSAVTPVVGDWNGDGIDTIGVFIDGTWYLRDSNSGGNPTRVLSYGGSGYAPVVGDWNGDHVDTIGVYVGDTFYLRDSNSNGSPNLTIPYGAAGWRPLAGDWNDDGQSTIGVVAR